VNGRCILAAGAWDDAPEYPRARSLLSALRHSGNDVVEYRAELPYGGHRKRAAVRQPWLWPAMAVQLRRARRQFREALAREIERCRPAAVLVPYPGHAVVPWVRQVFDGPLVLDLFLSAYDTTVVDRNLFAEGSLAARMLLRLDQRACAAADLILLDTATHARHVAGLVGCDAARFSWLPVSDPDAPALAPSYRPPRPGERLEVLFFGTGVPLHGLEHLLSGIGQVANVRLTLIGGTAAERELAARMPTDRIRLLPAFVPRSRIDRELARCHLVAGVFGDGGKTQRVIPFKVVHGLAFGRPVLTAKSPPVSDLLEPPRDCAVCPAADAAAIAASLAHLAGDPGLLVAMARQARLTYDAVFSTDAVARQLQSLLSQMLGQCGAAPLAALSAGGAPR